MRLSGAEPPVYSHRTNQTIGHQFWSTCQRPEWRLLEAKKYGEAHRKLSRENMATLDPADVRVKQDRDGRFFLDKTEGFSNLFFVSGSLTNRA